MLTFIGLKCKEKLLISSDLKSDFMQITDKQKQKHP